MSKTIALDADFIRLMKSGSPLYLRMSSPGSYAVGDIIGVKETHRYTPDGIVEYFSETSKKNPAGWRYSNVMNPAAIKRYIRVESIKKYSPEEYPELPFAYKETTYNRLPFYIEDIEYYRPLRIGGHAEPPRKRFWIVEFMPFDGFEYVYDMSGTKNNLPN